MGGGVGAGGAGGAGVGAGGGVGAGAGGGVADRRHRLLGRGGRGDEEKADHGK